ncbi:hypothetical protein CR513_42576, partial [Mucuna pruriens]
SDVAIELDKAVMSALRLGHPDWATMLGPLCSFRLLDCKVGRCIKYDLSHTKAVSLPFPTRTVQARKFELDEELLQTFRKVEINILSLMPSSRFRNIQSSSRNYALIRGIS